MEFDSIAKEIFISAQNHISMVDNESYLGNGSFGSPESSSDTEGVYYYVVGSDKAILNGNNSLSLMLPFASIDETVRQGGSYIIRYHKQSARILDVFYTTPSSRFGHVFTESEYKTLMDSYRGDEHKKDRREYGTDKKVIGYYGGEEANTLAYVDDLPKPELTIVNAERLKVEISNAQAIKDKHSDAKLRIIVTGLKSGKSRYVDLVLSDNTEYVLDSITESGMHFYDLFCNGEQTSDGHTEIKGSDNLIPGENITIQAKVFVESSLCKLAFSDKKGTNSIFGDDTTNVKADINNIRHLENLDPEVSRFNVNSIKTAEQSADLAWDSFLNKIGGEVHVYKPGVKNEEMTSAGKYYPVQMPSYIDTYDGKNHKISKIDASATGNSGLFSSVNAKTIKDLELVDFQIRATGDNGYAGALAGSISATTVENVGIHDSSTTCLISASTVAGGLIGKAENSSKIDSSFAAVVVNGGSYAGGLVGVSDDSTIDKCYAAGHTENGKYIQSRIDVVSTGGYAGGLVGNSKNSSVKDSYATTSVNGGSAAGGFVGTATGMHNDEIHSYSFSNCYSVGYVYNEGSTSTNKGGFTGSEQSSVTYSNCTYLAIANNSKLNTVGNKTEVTGLTASDVASASHGAAYLYTHFLSSNLSKNDALPYDSYLTKSYHYKNIGELSSTEPEGLVKRHFGDWPLYETLVVNE